MGGIDKAFVEIAGRPMIEHVFAVIAPQVARVVVSIGPRPEPYRIYPYDLVIDAAEDYAGPVAGIASGLAAARTELLLVVPCDAPLVAPVLAARLESALEGARADIAVAHDGRRVQPVFALLRRELGPSALGFLERGGRKVESWYAEHRLAVADMQDVAESFANINDPQDRRRIEALLVRG
jgi:molybdopterin-guanine dinucleotide biosynthesis protein A